MLDMNEKIAKKIGEAYAFSIVLKELKVKTSDVFIELFGDDSKNVLEVSSMQIKSLEELSKEFSMKDTVITKAEKTSKKITEMGEFYVGNDWDDSAEVLEWMSFFLGAAIVHWQLILGAAKKMNNKEFELICNDGVDYYSQLLNKAKLKAEEIGAERV